MVFTFFPVDGNWFSSQLDGLGDGRKIVHDSLNFDCSVFPGHAWPDTSSEFCNNNITFDGARDIGEVRIDLAYIGVVTPIIPVFLEIFGSLCNHANCNLLPLRHAITCDTHFVGM